MILKKQETLTKSKIVNAIKSSKENTFEVFELLDKSDLKNLNKNLENSIKKGSVSVIILGGGK